MGKNTDLNELYDYLSRYSWYVVEVMHCGFCTCFESTGYEPVQQGVAFDNLTVNSIDWFDINAGNESVYIRLSDSSYINIICMGIISMTEKLYEVMEQFHSFIINIHSDEITFIIGTHSRIRFEDDEIIGDDLTIRNVKDFTAYEDCENPGIVNIDIAFTDSATMTISCI